MLLERADLSPALSMEPGFVRSIDGCGETHPTGKSGDCNVPKIDDDCPIGGEQAAGQKQQQPYASDGHARVLW